MHRKQVEVEDQALKGGCSDVQESDGDCGVSWAQFAAALSHSEILAAILEGVVD